MNEYIIEAQRLGNEITGFGIDEDGIYGPQTKKMIIGVLQWAMNKDYGAGLDVDGIWGPASEGACNSHYVQFGETQHLVTAVEIGLMAHGYNAGGVEIPGQFGSGLLSATTAFQKDNGLEADGIVGYDTIHKLIDESGSGGGVPLAPYDPDNLPNFNNSEFCCECGCGLSDCDELKIRIQMLRDKLCEHYGCDVPIVISSGARCPSQNARDGGVSNSLHLSGEAADIYLGNISMDAPVIDTIKELAHSCGMTVGTYYTSRFVHCQIHSSSDFYGD